MNITSIQNQLIYTTIRIVASDSQEVSIGTGFFVNHEVGGKSEIFLVTNNHVVKNYNQAQIVFCAMKDGAEPDDNNHVIITLNNLQAFCNKHATLDICLIHMKDIIKAAETQGKSIFFRSIPTDLFISNDMINQLSAIEDVIMIGYPEGLIDSKNNKPVVRRGITATSLSLDFEGRKEFVIDAACFHGSSGSPVFF